MALSALKGAFEGVDKEEQDDGRVTSTLSAEGDAAVQPHLGV